MTSEEELWAIFNGWGASRCCPEWMPRRGRTDRDRFGAWSGVVCQPLLIVLPMGAFGPVDEWFFDQLFRGWGLCHVVPPPVGLLMWEE